MAASAPGRKRRPAGFEPALDLSAFSLLPRRSYGGCGFDDDHDDDGANNGISKDNASKVVQLEWHARGLTSSVYKARLPGGSGRDVCVKVTSLDLLARPHSAEREIACLSHLRGAEHVVELLDAFVDCPDPFSTNYELIMALYPFELGALLDEPTTTPLHWSDNGPASLLKAAPSYLDLVSSVATGLATGLQAIHRAGIAHRDIKPSNILLKADGTPVLADFATAWEVYKAEVEAGSKSRHEGDDGRGGLECAVGTGAYRAPEVLFSPQDGYDVFKLDIWELGVTLTSFFMDFEPPARSADAQTGADQVEPQGWSGSFFGGHGDARRRGPSGLKAAQTPIWFSDDKDDSEDELEGQRVLGAPLRKAEPPQRKTLFEGDRGEIGLASSIFRILGLPERQEEWPESATFRPSFDRLPFERHAPERSVIEHLPIIEEVQSQAQTPDDTAKVDAIANVISQALQLSAAKRPSADEVVTLLRGLCPTT